jgi:hypothetical protein
MTEKPQIDKRMQVLVEALSLAYDCLMALRESDENSCGDSIWTGGMEDSIPKIQSALSLASKPPVEIAGMTKEQWGYFSESEYLLPEEYEAVLSIAMSMADKPKEGVE